MNHSEIRKFLNLYFFNSSKGFGSKILLLFQFLVDILPRSVDPHIFADPDPETQNLVDPTDLDPDPKHWLPL